MSKWGVVLVVALVACEARLSLGTPCALDSECEAPLVCRLGRCRSECAATRDCPRGSVCVRTGDLAVCQLPADACAAPSDCVGGLTCVVGRCTNGCVSDTDCAGGSHCGGSGGCVECETDGECAIGLRCREGACVPECTSDADCGEGRCVDFRCEGPDGGPASRDAAPPVVLFNDRCEDALTVVARGAAASIYAGHAPWTDDMPSCGSRPDGYFIVELPHQSVLTIATGGQTRSAGLLPMGCTPVTEVECGSDGVRALLDAGPTYFVAETDAASGEPGIADIDVMVVDVGPGASGLRFGYETVLAERVTLTGTGGRNCAPGPSLVFYPQVGLGSYSAHLDATAVDPTVTLQWATASNWAEQCRDPAVGVASIDDGVDSGEIVILVAPGATGSVEVDLAGTIGP